MPVVTAYDEFNFACRDTLPCFTQCCRDVNIYLTPYDVLRLRRTLKIGSAEFLAKYTCYFLAKGSNIPVVRFEMNSSDLSCRLLSDRGCTVYDDRPWACRMFPLDLTPNEGEYRTIVGKERCKGLGVASSQTAGDWLKGQGVEPYLEMEAVFHSVMPPGFNPVACRDAGLGKLLFLAYDLDRFSAMLEEERFRTFYQIDDSLLQKVKEDDQALLLLSYRYIRSQIEELYQVV